MNKFLAGVLIAGCFLPACSKSPSERLQGKWIGDHVIGAPADKAAEVDTWAKATSFEFIGEKVTVTIPAEQPRTGAFRAQKVVGDKLALLVTREGGATDETSMELAEDGSLRWNAGEGRQVVFAKLK